MSPTHTSSTRRRLADAFGFAAVAAALVLAWPGLETARADEASLMSVDPVLIEAQVDAQKTHPGGDPAAPGVAKLELPTTAGPSCANPGTPSTLDDAMVAHQAKRMLMRELAKQIDSAPPGQPWIAKTDEGIVLNGHGYNYHPARQDPLDPTP